MNRRAFLFFSVLGIALFPWLQRSSAACGGAGDGPDVPRVAARVERIASGHRDTTVLRSYGRSGEGRELLALEIGGRSGERAPGGTIVLVAGLDGRETASVEIALRVAERFAAAPPPEGVRLVVVPAVHPDGVERAFAGRGPPGAGGVAALVDDDADGRFEEDPPRDVDGDGLVTWMRQEVPQPPLEPTLVPHPDEPRLLVEPDPSIGERATHALLPEGLDADGDGLVAEDGGGGIDLRRHFPIDWPEDDRTAGRVPLEAPEARALADLLLSYDDLLYLFVLDRGDRIERLPPAKPLGDRRALPEGIAEEDRATFARVREARKAALGERKAEAAQDAGSLHRFAYAALGAPAFVLPAVTPSDLLGEGQKPDARDARGRAWLALAERLGRGFVEWRPFDHPTLGRVEIGGFVPGFLGWAPDEVVERRAQEEERFLRSVFDLRPVIEVVGPFVRPEGEGLVRVEITVRNVGRAPTETHVLSRLSLRTAHALALLLPGRSERLAGDPVVRIGPIAPGGSVRAEWLVRSADPGEIAVEERSRFVGRRRLEVRRAEEGDRR